MQGDQDFLTVGAKGQARGGRGLRTATTDDDTVVNDGEIVGSVGIFSDGTSGQNSFNNPATISVTSTGIIPQGEKTGDAIPNSGHINATNVGIQVGDNAGYSNVITNSGVIQANECIEVSSDNTLDFISNSGLISADQNGYAISIKGTVGGYLDTIENSGAIQGSMETDADSRVSIDNTGTWSQGGIDLSAGDSTLTNSGQIEAADYAIYMSKGDNKLTNSGSITGAISMGAVGGPT